MSAQQRYNHELRREDRLKLLNPRIHRIDETVSSAALYLDDHESHAQGPDLFSGCQHGELLSPESYGPEADPPHLRFASTVLQR